MQKQKYISLMCLISMTLGTSAWSQGPGGRPGQGGPGGFRPGQNQGPGQQGPGRPGQQGPGQQGPGRQGGGWGGQGGRHYGGQDYGVARINTPVFNTGCGQLYPQQAQAALLDACIKGGAAGLNTAERYSEQQGRTDGFKTGYAWGVRNGIDTNTNEPNHVAQGQAAVNTPNMQARLSTADQAGAAAGAAAGAPNGDSEAVSRFHTAIDSGAMPSQDLSAQDFARYNPTYSTRYTSPYAQTVVAPFTEGDLLSGRVPGYNIDFGNVTFYTNGYDASLYGNNPQFRVTDFYTADGRYSFDRNSVLNAENAFNSIYMTRGGFDRTGYQGLGSVQIITGYTQPAAPAPIPATPPVAQNPPTQQPGQQGPGQQGPGRPGMGGQGGGQQGPGQQGPGRPGDGRPVAQGPVAPTAPAAPVASSVPATPVQAAPQPIYTTYDLKAIFKQAFINSYNSAAAYYYNDAYNDMLDDGTNAGYYVGAQVGQYLAYENGMINEYNRQFAAREASAFTYGIQGQPESGYQAAFAGSFSRQYTNYATHPQLGVDSFSISGIRDDGIVEPGEGITASFVVRNYGGVDASIPVSLEGDVTGVQPATLTIGRLSTSTQRGILSANIASNVASQSNANVVLNANGNRIPLTQYVTRQVITSNAAYNADYARGNISVTLPIQNVSRVNSYDAVKVVVTDSLGRTQNVAVGFIGGGQTWNSPVNLTGFDQIDMIDGRINLTAQAYLGSVQIASARLVVSTTDRQNQLAAAFEVVAQGTNAAMIQKMNDRIFNDIKNEATNTESGNYDDGHASLLLSLVKGKASRAQNATTLNAYKAMADRLQAGNFTFRHAAIHFGTPVNQRWFKDQLDKLRSR